MNRSLVSICFNLQIGRVTPGVGILTQHILTYPDPIWPAELVCHCVIQLLWVNFCHTRGHSSGFSVCKSCGFNRGNEGDVSCALLFSEIGWYLLIPTYNISTYIILYQLILVPLAILTDSCGPCPWLNWILLGAGRALCEHSRPFIVFQELCQTPEDWKWDSKQVYRIHWMTLVYMR